MISLLKFEFQRKKGLFLVAFFLVCITQFLMTVRFFSINESFRVDYFEGFVILYVVVTLLVFIILYLMDIVALFRNDVYKPEGYMLFLTPNSGYRILGSKLIFATIEGIFTAGIFFTMLLINARMLYGAEFFTDLLQIDADWSLISMLCRIGVSVVVGLVGFALTIYLSFAIYKSLFPNFRFKGLLTLGIFIAISIVKAQILAHISAMQIKQTYVASVDESDFVILLKMINEAVSVNLIFNTLAVIIFFFITGYLLEKKINL